MTRFARLGRAYRLGPNLARAAWPPPYATPQNAPRVRRTLRVFALDPSLPRHQGSVAAISVPLEHRLGPGPRSGLFTVESDDPCSAERYAATDLDDESLPRESAGYEPDVADPRFHGQMVYAVALLTYESFRKAIGRFPHWAFDDGAPERPAALRLRPFAMREPNAHYTRAERAACFGYRLPCERPRTPAEMRTVFTSLSSDIVAHEVTHALLDGLRPNFAEPTNPDVDALHEALADLVALFQRFTYTELVRAQLARTRGRLSRRTLLRVIAPELGDAMDRNGAAERGLRTFRTALGAIEKSPDGVSDEAPTTLSGLPFESRELPHARGRLLAEAIFDAFHSILERKLDPLFRLASNGTGELPAGALPVALLDRLVHTTSRTASQFLTICIRAIDYCPPVHVEFGDYLRALITADHELVREDPCGYREAIINACLLREIFPRYLRTPSERSLVWNGPRCATRTIPELALGRLRFEGDPSIPPDGAEIERQACLFGERLAAHPDLHAELGLHAPNHEYSVPEIVSVRASRRVGPDDQLNFALIVEVEQHRTVRIAGRALPVRGGATVVLDPLGTIRYIVRKRVDQPERLAEIRRFLGSGGNPERIERVMDLDRRGVRGLCFAKGPSSDGAESADHP